MDSGSKQDAPLSFQSDIERDLAIYHSYTATVCVINALMCCGDYSCYSAFAQRQNTEPGTWQESSHDSVRHNARSARVPSKNDTLEQSHSQSESSQVPSICSTTSSFESYKQQYEAQVVKNLQIAKDHVKDIYPLCFRLETLENLFSLLFLHSSSSYDKTSSIVSSGDEGAEERIGILTPKLSGSIYDSVNSTPQTPHSPGTPVPTSEMPILVLKTPEAQADDIANKLADHQEESKMKDLDSKDDNVFSSGHEAKKKSTDHWSTNSTASNKGLTRKLGFLANDYLMRDLLHIIKYCLVDLTTTRFVLTGHHQAESSSSLVLPENASTLETELSKCLVCSVSAEDLQGRLSRLSNYVSEGQWRLQLVSDIPVVFGEMLAGAASGRGLVESSSEEDDTLESGESCNLCLIIISMLILRDLNVTIEVEF